MAHPQRKTTFVDPKVQGALVRRLVLHWLAFIAVAAGVAFCLQVLTDPFSSIEEHARKLWFTHGPFLLVLFFLMPVFIVDTIKLSHRFTGPIYRLRRVVHDIAEGKPVATVKFRDGDYWQGLASDFNAMLERLTSERGAGGAAVKLLSETDAEAPDQASAAVG